MKEISLQEAKELSFAVLCMINDVCHEHNITYSLTGGTLLGAVRHKGFIPWDDDIDITMPRPDYLRFIDIVSSEDKGFDFFSKETHGKDYNYPFGKACHKNTVIVENDISNDGIPFGVYVDIFPVDGVGSNYFFAKLRCLAAQILCGLRVASGWKSIPKSRSSSRAFRFVRTCCYYVSRVFKKELADKAFEKLVHKSSFEESKYAARVGGSLRTACILQKDKYCTTTEVEFEGKKFDALENYNEYLTRFFGNYMELPPVENRFRHHNFTAYWI